jgi:hypothetical protein
VLFFLLILSAVLTSLRLEWLRLRVVESRLSLCVADTLWPFATDSRDTADEPLACIFGCSALSLKERDTHSRHGSLQSRIDTAFAHTIAPSIVSRPAASEVQPSSSSTSQILLISSIK